MKMSPYRQLVTEQKLTKVNLRGCNGQSGLTLIELMVTVAIITIIAGIAYPAYVDNVELTRMNECRNEITALQLAEEAFFFENQTYFAGNSIAELQANSGNQYIPSGRFGAGNSGCSLSVVAGGAGIATQYQIIATGQNALDGVDLGNITYQNYKTK